MLVFKSASEYVETCTSVKAQIAAIDAIVTALFLVALKAAENGDISQYSLDNGQTVVQTTYRTAKDVADSIAAFKAIRKSLVNDRIGIGMVRLVDSKNFRS